MRGRRSFKNSIVIKTAGESKSIKSIDEKEAEVETQFGDDEETENLEEEQPEKKDQETVEESSEKKDLKKRR